MKRESTAESKCYVVRTESELNRFENGDSKQRQAKSRQS